MGTATRLPQEDGSPNLIPTGSLVSPSGPLGPLRFGFEDDPRFKELVSEEFRKFGSLLQSESVLRPKKAEARRNAITRFREENNIPVPEGPGAEFFNIQESKPPPGSTEIVNPPRPLRPSRRSPQSQQSQQSQTARTPAETILPGTKRPLAPQAPAVSPFIQSPQALGQVPQFNPFQQSPFPNPTAPPPFGQPQQLPAPASPFAFSGLPQFGGFGGDFATRVAGSQQPAGFGGAFGGGGFGGLGFGFGGRPQQQQFTRPQALSQPQPRGLAGRL